MNVFLGITGASGAPYAARLLSALSQSGTQVGVSISDSGFEVLATELHGDPGMARDEVVARLTDGLAGVTVYDVKDYKSPYASGSAKVDGYVICPCSMATAGTIAAGAMANLVHRAASVALKEERKLILVPRETPLSTIQLENLLRLRRAGATVLFAAPGFYNSPQTIDDLIEFVVGRCLDQLGIENRLTRRWGQE
ncbi:MAG TPA: UbiX family flavin prenyltransferase [Gaiellaceae bacterium]|jgi:4-hydroxy-3-polyprenylbenzoate decarboxylase|nr:UbiX family flavin prenyltransferase [Gaiellaceae bacterium]